MKENEPLFQQNLKDRIEEFEDLGQDKEAGPYIQVRVDQIDGFGLCADRVSPATLGHLLEHAATCAA